MTAPRPAVADCHGTAVRWPLTVYRARGWERMGTYKPGVMIGFRTLASDANVQLVKVENSGGCPQLTTEDNTHNVCMSTRPCRVDTLKLIQFNVMFGY